MGYIVFSAFDGMSCGQIAFKELGIKVDKYYASEVDKYAIMQTQHNFPNTIQLGSIVDVDVTKLEPIDLLIGGSPCFAAGTKVLTIDGYKNIEDIVVGDMVLTHKNRFMPVLRIGGKVANTFTLKVQGFTDVVCTENHPFYARKKLFEYYTQSNGKKSKRMALSDPEWINAGNLNGDYYVCSNIQNIESRNDMNINEDEAYVIGRYIADGHTRKDIRFDKKPNGNKGHNGSRAWQLILSVGNDKVDRFCSNIKHLHYSCYKHGDGVHRIVFSNKRLVEIVEKFCGVGSINKHFGEPIINLPKNLLSIVLKGFLDGDGCFNDGKWSVTTISPMLQMTISRVISKIYGTHSNISIHKPKEYREIMGRTVHQNTQYLIRSSEKHLEYDKAKIIEDKIWSSVKSFTNNKIQNVYNLEVLEDNSYTANNFVVHNCQSFSFAGKRNGMSTTENEEIYTLDRYLQLKEEGFQFEGQSYLFWEYMRILTDIRKYNPDVKFLLENVEMGDKWERVLSEAIGIFGVHINSALVSAQNRKRIYWTNIRVKQVGLFGELHSDIPQPKDEGILLKDILEEEVDEKYYLSEKGLAGMLKHKENNTNNGNGFGVQFITRETDKSNSILQRGYKDCKDNAVCVAMRGRNPDNPSDTTSGSPTEQRLEPNLNGKTNTITTVQKDNLVLQIKEATSKGYAEINPGECFDFENPNSNTRRGRKMEEKSNSLMAQNMSFMNYTKDYRIRRLTPTECARLQTIPEWYKWESIKTICQNFNSNNICQQYANQKDVINQSQVKKLACATNTILGLLETVKQNYQDMSLIRANNVAWKVAVENNKQASMSASCTINDLKSMGLLNCLNEITSQNLNVNFVLKRLEEMVVLECAISTTKCGKFTEILYIPKKTESNQAEMDIIEILMENNFIGKLQKKLSEENLSKELRLSIILTLINLIMSQVIWSYLRNPNTHLYINSSIELQENSLELKLSNIKMDRITKTSDSSIYKMLGNGWTVKVIMHILKYLS